jgi:maleate cis-trans isomerase
MGESVMASWKVIMLDCTEGAKVIVGHDFDKEKERRVESERSKGAKK